MKIITTIVLTFFLYFSSFSQNDSLDFNQALKRYVKQNNRIDSVYKQCVLFFIIQNNTARENLNRLESDLNEFKQLSQYRIDVYEILLKEETSETKKKELRKIINEEKEAIKTIEEIFDHIESKHKKKDSKKPNVVYAGFFLNFFL